MSSVESPMASIVILNYNGKEFLVRCLNSVFEQSHKNFEVIVVDNASTDGSVENVKAKFSNDNRFRIIEKDRNYGPIEGNNIGIRVSDRRGKYIVLLNNDTELTDSWLEGMIDAMETDPTIGGACSKQLLMGDPTRLQGVGSFIDLYGFNYLVGEGEIDNGQYGNEPIPIFHAGTTALVIRKELLRKIGLLDSRFQHGFDDIDFCWRIMLAGYKVVCVPSCSMYHKVAGTTGKVHLDHVVYHREKNRIMTAIKNYSLKNQIRVLPVILIFDLIQIGWFILSRNQLMFLAMIKALTWDVRNFKYIWGQRLIIEYRIRRVPDKRILGRMLKFNATELRRRLIAVSQ